MTDSVQCSHTSGFCYILGVFIIIKFYLINDMSLAKIGVWELVSKSWKVWIKCWSWIKFLLYTCILLFNESQILKSWHWSHITASNFLTNCFIFMYIYHCHTTNILLFLHKFITFLDARMWTTTSRSCWRNGKLPYSLWDRNNKIIFLMSCPPPPPLSPSPLPPPPNSEIWSTSHFLLQSACNRLSVNLQNKMKQRWYAKKKTYDHQEIKENKQWECSYICPPLPNFFFTFSSHWYTLISHGHLFAGQYYCLQLHCTTQNAVLCLSQSSLPLPYKSFIACVQEHLEIYLQVFYTQAIMFKYISFSISFFFLSHQASLHLFLRCLKHRNYLMN